MTGLPGKPAANSTPENSASDLLSASPGARLRKAREAQQMDVTEAANSLNLSAGVVKALEADDYRSLPNAIFVKGYIRSYARVLDIPGEDLVRAYEAVSGCNQVNPQPPMQSFKNDSKPIAFLVGGAFILVVMLAWLFWPGSDAGQVAPDEENKEMATTFSDPAVQPAISNSQPDEPLSEVTPELEVKLFTQSPVEKEPVPALELEQNTQQVAVTEPEITEPEVTAFVTRPELVEPKSIEAGVLEGRVAEVEAIESEAIELAAEEVVPSEQDVAKQATGIIDMTFTGDCWVEVRDATEKLIYSNLKRRGEILTIDGAPPLEAKLGNGNMVSLIYNGQPVSFRVPRHNVVRVRLGE